MKGSFFCLILFISLLILFTISSYAKPFGQKVSNKTINEVKEKFLRYKRDCPGACAVSIDYESDTEVCNCPKDCICYDKYDCRCPETTNCEIIDGQLVCVGK